MADAEDRDWQRLDKWLWCARFMKARADCARLVAEGMVRINRQPTDSAEIATCYVVTVVCRSTEEAHVRALLLQGFSTGDLHLRELDSSNIEDSDRVEVLAVLSVERRADSILEQIVGRLSLESAVTAALLAGRAID